MKFLSYAQNFEDVILNRVFKGKDDGFYIDVGAAHPTGHSVTKNFYDRGWCGINVEPGSTIFGLIEAERGRDINLNIALSDKEGRITFYEAPDSIGVSTVTDSFRDHWNTKDGVEFVQKEVPVRTLAQICEEHVKDRPIDFLKIDVEGHELAVLNGGDFSRWRPRVVLAEGPREQYDAPLIAAGYLHAAWDRVNHYFVREEDRDLIPLLAPPVSLVVDNFELYEDLKLARDLQWRLDQEHARHEETRGMLAQVTARRDELEASHAASPKRSLWSFGSKAESVRS